MTYLQKVLQEHPEYHHCAQEVISNKCPGEFFVDAPVPLDQRCLDTQVCDNCWDTEIPEEV
jgi:hypothetical protein